MVKVDELILNESNPREISKENFNRLKNSIKEFSKMMALRPIVVDKNNVVLGGNMRLRAIKELGYIEIPDEWVKVADSLTDEERERFIIEDNVNFGKWDWDVLANEWDYEKLNEWGLDVPETFKLTEIKNNGYDSMYYTPEKLPKLKLNECLDLMLFNKKIKVIEESNLSDEQKNVMRCFAYRFIRIDFEMVANYYYFNATEEEKRVIERLRLVLCDNGVNGFIEDELLLINSLVNSYDEND